MVVIFAIAIRLDAQEIHDHLSLVVLYVCGLLSKSCTRYSTDVVEC